MGGGLRSNVKRYAVKRSTTLDADTVHDNEIVDSSLSEPRGSKPAEEKLVHENAIIDSSLSEPRGSKPAEEKLVHENAIIDSSLSEPRGSKPAEEKLVHENEIVNSDLSEPWRPKRAEERLMCSCSCQMTVQSGTTTQLKDDTYARNKKLASNLDANNLTGLFCYLALPRAKKSSHTSFSSTR
ncbi:hypothetical protein C1H46_037844 [Malus baccata]|uniref:Uncharacterized protein n=1 Tax=Malus baccata TaxID=106549 RepID=A0A540KQZ6_MALBA|nr:hypothetical protein C1H46_037844 [Malus baccata]